MHFDGNDYVSHAPMSGMPTCALGALRVKFNGAQPTGQQLGHELLHGEPSTGGPPIFRVSQEPLLVNGSWILCPQLDINVASGDFLTARFRSNPLPATGDVELKFAFDCGQGNIIGYYNDVLMELPNRVIGNSDTADYIWSGNAFTVPFASMAWLIGCALVNGDGSLVWPYVGDITQMKAYLQGAQTPQLDMADGGWTVHSG